MQLAGWQRVVPLSGVLFVILFIVGGVFLDLPGGSDSDSEVVAWYSDSGNRVGVIVTAYLYTIGGVAFLAFANRLRNVIHEAEGGRPLLATAAFAGGIVFVTGLLVATAAFAAIPGAVEFGDEQVPGADIARMLPQLGAGMLLVMGMFPAILMIAVTALATFRYQVFPSWFGWLSVVCAIALLFAALFLPGIALLIWVLVASVLLYQRQPAAATA